MLTRLWPLIVYNPFRSSPLFEIDRQACLNELVIMNGDILIGIKKLLNGAISHHRIQNRILLIFPRNSSIDKLIGNNANSPYITKKRILIILQSLRGHIVRRSHIVIKLPPAHLLTSREPKICNLDQTFRNEDIGKFQIPVHNPQIVQLFVAIEQLFHDGLRLSLVVSYLLA